MRRLAIPNPLDGLSATLESPNNGTDDPADQPTDAFEPVRSARGPLPSSSPLAAAIARRKLLVLACAGVLAALGAADGLGRTPTYTAAATLQVGKVNPNSPGFYGFVQSASDLATVFSRAIAAAPVLRAVHEHLRLSTRQVAARLSAAPVPESPVFRVIATGPSARAALELANVAAVELVRYEGRANSYNPESGRLLSEYRAASLTLATATSKLSEATHEYAGDRTAALQVDVEHAQSARDAAALQVQALASSYQLSAESTTSGLVSLLAGATSAASDRASKVQLLGFIGLLGGLVLGCALAILAEQGRERRRHAARRLLGTVTQR